MLKAIASCVAAVILSGCGSSAPADADLVAIAQRLIRDREPSATFPQTGFKVTRQFCLGVPSDVTQVAGYMTTSNTKRTFWVQIQELGPRWTIKELVVQ